MGTAETRGQMYHEDLKRLQGQMLCRNTSSELTAAPTTVFSCPITGGRRLLVSRHLGL